MYLWEVAFSVLTIIKSKYWSTLKSVEDALQYEIFNQDLSLRGKMYNGNDLISMQICFPLQWVAEFYAQQGIVLK